jgi:hypothetical protein
VPFDGALTPGPRDGGLDGGQVRPEAFGEAPEGREGGRARVAARVSHGSSSAGWRWRTRPAKSCARATAAVSSGACWVSCASWWRACSVDRSDGRRTSQVARRGVSGRRGASITAGSGGWRRPILPASPP